MSFLFPQYSAGTISSSSWVQVREVRSTQGGGRFRNHIHHIHQRMLGKLYHSSIHEHKGPRPSISRISSIMNDPRNGWFRLSLQRRSAPCPPCATSTTTTRRRTAATTASSPVCVWHGSQGRWTVVNQVVNVRGALCAVAHGSQICAQVHGAPRRKG